MCPYSELIWSVFSRIRTEYGEIRRRDVHSECGEIRIRMATNMDTFHAVTSPQAHQDLHLLADNSKI